MISKKDNVPLLWRKFLNTLTTFLKPIQKTIRNFSEKYPHIAQVIQLTFVYFFAYVDLFSTILSYIFSLGILPEIISPFYNTIESILLSPLLQFWASPEKVFFFSYLVIEFMVVRSVFNFSKVVRYNILLVFSLLMLQGLVISYWDLITHRAISSTIKEWAYEEVILFSDTNLAYSLFFTTFILFFFTYLYLYITALRNKFATFPGFEWITDSVCFWLKIKTPTMRAGKRKKKKR